jgi:hypothetical protein
MAPPRTSVFAINQPETGLQGVVDAALRIAEGRAQKEKQMRHAILADDIRAALTMASELAGLSQREAAKHVKEMLASAGK